VIEWILDISTIYSPSICLCHSIHINKIDKLVLFLDENQSVLLTTNLGKMFNGLRFYFDMTLCQTII